MKDRKIALRIRRFIQSTLDTLQSNLRWRTISLVSLLVMFVIGTSLMFPSSKSFQFSNLKEGDVFTDKEIIAPFTFFINKSENEITLSRTIAAEEVPLVFRKVDSLETASIKTFADFFNAIETLREATLPDSLKFKKLQEVLNNNFVLIEYGNIEYLLTSPFVSEQQPDKKRSRNSVSDLDRFEQKLKRIFIDQYAIGILNKAPNEIPVYVKKLIVVTPDRETEANVGDFYNLENYKNIVLENLRNIFKEQELAVKIGYPILTSFLKPNLIYDETVTSERMQEAVSSVPLSKGIVLENERIVNTHEVITIEILEKLQSLASAKDEKEVVEGGLQRFLPVVGKLLTVSLALAFTLLFLSSSRPEIFLSLKKMLMIFIIFMFVIGITFFINSYSYSSNLKFLIPIALASMLLTIFFDNRTAFIGTVTLSIIIGAMRGNDFGIMVISMFVGSLSTFAVREIQARAWILKGIFYIAGAYFISIATIEFLKHSEIVDIWAMLGYGFINALLSSIFAFGFMVIFEQTFQMVTNSTLLELSDLNKPLLKQLAIRAPGSYHHSIMVGNLSEGAAETIGANALLARVGSYYHDIGKMEKPEYFVENQKGGKNPHDKLTPTMSCLILINHVKRGLEIAEEYGLPREIRDFISQHHGTNIIRFFYQKAIENNEDAEVDENSFRYPGPKPQTKETGIVMLADSIEAGSRSLKEPTVGRIRSMVSSIVNERLFEAELDECPLTLRDLSLVRESFVNTLTGMFHGRIEYPNQDLKIVRKPMKKSA